MTSSGRTIPQLSAISNIITSNVAVETVGEAPFLWVSRRLRVRSAANHGCTAHMLRGGLEKFIGRLREYHDRDWRDDIRRPTWAKASPLMVESA